MIKVHHFRMVLAGAASCAAVVLSPAVAQAADPVGRWLDADGYAHIGVDICEGRLWGVVVWERKPGFDTKNPDSAKRGRPTLGMPVLLNMKPAGTDRWEGKVYNAQDGKTYDSKVFLKSADVLRVEGCVLGFLCGGQDWKRVPTPAAEDETATPPAPAPAPRSAAKSAAPAAPVGSRPAPGPGARPQATAAAAPLSPVCSAVLDGGSRATH